MKTNIFIQKKNAIRWLSLLLFGIFAIPAMAEKPNPEGAKHFAETFFRANAPMFAPGKEVSNTFALEERYQTKTDRKTPVFVYQNATDGFAVVAQNNGRFALVGYSSDGNFVAENIPPQLQALLQHYEDSLQINPSVLPIMKSGTPVMTPLLDEAGIALNQYNHENVGNCPTGCVATAFAQIMAFYKFPSKGIGSHCYTHSNYGQLCVDFGNTTYNWNNPTDADYEKLSFHVGVAMEMDYCRDSDGSAPSNHEYDNAIQSFFGYYLNKGPIESYFIRNEIDHRRPVYATIPGYPGHAVVLDGYDTEGLYHINFGWGGNHNGYFLLNSNSTFIVGGSKFGTNISKAVFLSIAPLKVVEQDSLALVAINDALNGSMDWDLTKPISAWEGVTIMSDRVVELNLSKTNYNAVKGSISPEIGKLTALRKLMMKGAFEGVLPESIINLTQLSELSIWGVADERPERLKVILPDDIDKWADLKSLNVHSYIDGAIPRAVGQLTKLERLELKEGNLTGTIPPEIGNITSLKELNLQGNKLTGSIPASIGNLSNLTTLNLSENELGGLLPPEITQLTKLTALSLHKNKLSGALPENIGSFAPILLITLNDNRFSGAVPPSISELKLFYKQLDLSNNQFTSLPEEIEAMNDLRELNVSGNRLSSLPESIIHLRDLVLLNAASNRISSLSPNFGLFPKLTEINLSDNILKEFPDALCRLPNLQYATFTKNKIEKFPASIDMLAEKLSLYLDDNEISGNIPKSLLEKEYASLFIANNRFTFENIPISSKLSNAVGDQKPVTLSKKVYKVGLGDRVNIDIREIAPFTLETNQYSWKLVGSNNEVNPTPNPILTVIIDENTIGNKYYCSVSNPSSPTYSFSDYGFTYTFPCLNDVTTETLSFQLASEEELISEKYKGSYTVSSTNIPAKTIEDATVTLVPPIKTRGTITWQASADGNTWHDLSETMAQNELRANFINITSGELVLSPITSAFYRCKVQDVNCEPIYSDTLRVKPLGEVLYSETVNVAQETKTIMVDNIEVTIPKGVYDKDFWLTITKLDNPPVSPEGVSLLSTYDVTVSFAETFDTPLLIKLKNIDKKTFDSKNIHNYKAVYLDKKTREWVPYDNSYISLVDTTMVFETNHLTVISVGWWDRLKGYDKGYERNNIHVYYKDSDWDYMTQIYGRAQKPQPWHVSDVPLLVQDVTEYLAEVRTKFKSEGLPVPETFNVYIKQMNDADGVVGISGMINDYLTIHALTDNPIALRSLLAHEYMHYTQGKYISPDPGNIFWMEATAHLSDRLVWNELVIPVSESENYLLDGRKDEQSIFNFLSTSWDYWNLGFWTQNLFGNIHYCYLAGTFLHYMRSYTDAENKLNPVKLLKEHTLWSGDSWRTYLNNYITTSMNSLIGDEYDNYVKYILSGENNNFTILNTPENPFSYLIKNSGVDNDGAFVRRINYKFRDSEQVKQKDEVELTIPYLASKVYLLYNSTPDRATFVSFKRKDDAPGYENKIYFGKYNFDLKKVEYTDISDSTQYYFMLESCTQQAMKESQNVCFLLFINKNNPRSGERNFDASFELTATPILDINHFGGLYVGGGSDGQLPGCNFSTGKSVLTMLGKNISVDITDYNKQIINDSTYVISSTLYRETPMEEHDGGGYTLATESEVTYRIEYNFITDQMNIISYSNSKYYAEKDNYGQSIPKRLNSHRIESGSIRLKNILQGMTFSILNADEGLIHFQTNTVQELKDVVQNLSLTGTRTYYNYNDEGEISNTIVEDYSFQSIDYATSGIKLRLFFWVD